MQDSRSDLAQSAIAWLCWSTLTYRANRVFVSQPGKRENLFHCAKSAFDGAVHVALPSRARVFAGKKYAVERESKERAHRRWKRRVEKRVATARPRIVFPSDAP